MNVGGGSDTVITSPEIHRTQDQKDPTDNKSNNTAYNQS